MDCMSNLCRSNLQVILIPYIGIYSPKCFSILHSLELNTLSTKSRPAVIKDSQNEFCLTEF